MFMSGCDVELYALLVCVGYNMQFILIDSVIIANSAIPSPFNNRS
jgi:hypothetical protein